MKKIEIFIFIIITIILVFVSTCFIYTEEIRGFLGNRYYITISFLVLYIICNVYSSEVRDKKEGNRGRTKYLANLSISIIIIAAVIFGMQIILFVIEWIKSLFN